MYLAPDGDEVEIADAAGTFLADAMPIDRLHSPGSADTTATVRRLFGDMGWFALAVPECEGGSGLSAVEHALFFREVGRQCGPVDVLAQCLAANAAIDGGLRGEIIAGRRGVALLVADGEAHRLIGSADSDLGLSVELGCARLFSLAAVPAAPRPSLDPANSLRIVETLPAPLESIDSERTWQLGQLGAAAMLVGIAEAALDLIVDYAKIRETFGRKIGSWQAVRHPCADMAVRLEAARSQLWYAAAAVKERRVDAAVHLDVAKHMANVAALANTDANIQLHGGIGVTDEHNAHLLMKHALLLSRLFGAKRMLLGRLLDARVED
ncbi:acyl-CoA dehydrogenase family protein [Novosphingobium sp. G106]|uniref:acyl-CoA dehydrogenase family protein n=1 Tax=Novosphingobium sp. G106 TaxID=2849500 RepID=UPI001C2DABA6|nr:acyl-CoA dehydrogenase family protein [Novosphingobium sp. G106]MBV1686155.1 acyl-CoA dehydrogenase family protein [Novosphingobium sp. G106]